MALEFLAAALAGPIIKHIAKLAFGEGLRSEITGASFDWFAGKISKYEAGKAELSVRAIAEQTVQELRPFFQRSRLTAEQQKSVADALGRTLDEVDVAEIVIDERFQARPVFTKLVKSSACSGGRARPGALRTPPAGAVGYWRSVMSGRQQATEFPGARGQSHPRLPGPARRADR